MKEDFKKQALKYLDSIGVDTSIDNYSWYGNLCEVVTKYTHGKLSVPEIMQAADKLSDLLKHGLKGFHDEPLPRDERISGQIRAMEFIPATKGKLTHEEKEAFAFCIYYYACTCVYDKKRGRMVVPIKDYESFDKIDAAYRAIKADGIHDYLFKPEGEVKDGTIDTERNQDKGFKQLPDEELDAYYEPIATPKISLRAPMMYLSQRIADAIVAQAEPPVSNIFTDITPENFSGGWGYSMKDACVISAERTSEGLAFERMFVERRIWDEVSLRCVKAGNELYGLKWYTVQQSLWEKDGKKYDRLRVQVTGYFKDDAAFLRDDVQRSGFTREHREKAAARRKGYVTDYWFEISSFFGK